MGTDYTVSWASAWPVIGEPFARALAKGTSFLENQRMFLSRNGYLEETFFTFSLSPIRNETSGIDGLFHPVVETTASMLGERRTRAVRDLTARMRDAMTPAEVCEIAARTLETFAFDVPFLLLYLPVQAEDVIRYRLAACTGLPAGTAASPELLEVGTTAPWPVAELVHSRVPAVVRGLAGAFGVAPCGPYDEPPDVALVTPIGTVGTGLPVALMVAGVSPRLAFDDAYRGFCDLVAAALGAALANAHADAEERRRAEALAAMDRAKTAFFSNVSHEFRTPLTLILGPIADALAEAADDLPAAQRERLEVAHRNALRLLRQVNALLDFTRVEAGRAEASFEPVDLAALTAELASNFRSACERAGLDLVVDCPPLAAPVHVDRDMWERIVLNLVSNAFTFTLAGSISVALHDTTGGVELVVRDTGVGIAADELPRIFERFYRAEGQRGRTHEGIGIGLALVEELVRLHGGTIHVGSLPGQGTEFRVTIPAGMDHLPLDRIRTPASTSSQAGAYVEEAGHWVPGEAVAQPDAVMLQGRPRIVLADDNADMRAYVARILEQADYAVEAAADGAAALAAARRQPPDLILADVMMPGLDGFGLLRALRADPALGNLPVILLSARAGEEARIGGLAAGADDYLVKPFGARELRARVDGAIGLARRRRDDASLHAQVAAGRARATLGESEQRLGESEQRLEFAMRAGRLGSWELDFVTRRFVASEICRADLGCAAPDALDTHDDVLARIHPDDREGYRDAMAQAIGTRSALDAEHRVLRADGGVGWVEFRGHAVYAGDGTPLRMTGVSLDVTTRKRAEARQGLLLKELNHWVKNTLVTVQSIAMQTLRNARTPAVFSENLTARIAALGRAHDLLTRASWDGASLADVVGETLAQHGPDADGRRRIEAEGPPVRLDPNAAVTLNMAFHELAANAAEHGALSVPNGRVSVSWNVERTAGAAGIAITWRETNGPRVEPPARRGFGTRLIEHGLTRELDGEVRLDFAPAGVCCHIRLPVSAKIALVA